jgi:D-alanyl-D-alanine endopeptidase (penicillin-binding protein 7)
MLGKLKVLPLAIALILTPAVAATTTDKPASAAQTKAAKPPQTKPAAVKASPAAAAPGTARQGTTAKPIAAKPPAASPRPVGSTASATTSPAKPLLGTKASAKATPKPARIERTRPARVLEEDAPSVPGDRWVNVESHSAMVVDANGNEVYAKNADVVMPIASITKLMTAMVVLDAQLPLDEPITVEPEDKDYLRNTYSRLQVGRQLTRRDMLHIALMSSENRAAAALGRAYPGGKPAFIRAMNAKARALGMNETRFFDSTGLDGNNVSTARDLVRLALAAGRYPLIREATTTSESAVLPLDRGTPMLYRNSNRLVRGGNWEISLSKTGYLNEAGRCLVMQAEVKDQPLVFVFLHGPGKLTPMGDASRIRAWLERRGDRTG